MQPNMWFGERGHDFLVLDLFVGEDANHVIQTVTAVFRVSWIAFLLLGR